MAENAHRLGWVVCANISDHLRGGGVKGRFYQGTRKFAKGTKVYLGAPFRGMGCMDIRVAGLHRTTRSWTSCVIQTAVLINIRLDGVYSQHKWDTLDINGAHSFEDRAQALEFMEEMTQVALFEQPEKLKLTVKSGPWGTVAAEPYRIAQSNPDVSLIHRAAQFARDAHTGQTRNSNSDTPYFTVVSNVAATVKQHTTDEAVIAAAWLHATLTKTATTPAVLRDLFGDRVAYIVQELTYDPALKGTALAQEKVDTARAKSIGAILIESAFEIEFVKSLRVDPPEWTAQNVGVYLRNSEILIRRLHPRLAVRAAHAEQTEATGRFWKTRPPPLP